MTRRPYEYEEEADPFTAIGIDAEWVFESERRNKILSYQFAVLNADNGKLTTLIVYPKDGKRIALENGLTRALLKARRTGVVDKVPSRFVIAGHFTRADLTTFADFGFFKRLPDEEVEQMVNSTIATHQGDAQALLHTTGEFSHQPAPIVAQPDLFQNFRRPAARLVLGNAI